MGLKCGKGIIIVSKTPTTKDFRARWFIILALMCCLLLQFTQISISLYLNYVLTVRFTNNPRLLLHNECIFKSKSIKNLGGLCDFLVHGALQMIFDEIKYSLV